MNSKAVGISVTAAIVAIAGLGVCLPNLLWLKHSTVRIVNRGDDTVARATLKVGDETVEYRSIEPGKTEFAMLPGQANGSVMLTLPPGQSLESFCHTYVDVNMYHLDVTVENGKVTNCRASLPILSSLLVLKAFL